MRCTGYYCPGTYGTRQPSETVFTAQRLTIHSDYALGNSESLDSRSALACGIRGMEYWASQEMCWRQLRPTVASMRLWE